MEENLRRALLISRGDPTVFFTRPISVGFMIATVLILIIMVLPAIRKRRNRRRKKGSASPPRARTPGWTARIPCGDRTVVSLMAAVVRVCRLRVGMRCPQPSIVSASLIDAGRETSPQTRSLAVRAHAEEVRLNDGHRRARSGPGCSRADESHRPHPQSGARRHATPRTRELFAAMRFILRFRGAARSSNRSDGAELEGRAHLRRVRPVLRLRGERPGRRFESGHGRRTSGCFPHSTSCSRRCSSSRPHGTNSIFFYVFLFPILVVSFSHGYRDGLIFTVASVAAFLLAGSLADPPDRRLRAQSCTDTARISARARLHDREVGRSRDSLQAQIDAAA